MHDHPGMLLILTDHLRGFLIPIPLIRNRYFFQRIGEFILHPGPFAVFLGFVQINLNFLQTIFYLSFRILIASGLFKQISQLIQLIV